jgi:hypothetical protein
MTGEDVKAVQEALNLDKAQLTPLLPRGFVLPKIREKDGTLKEVLLAPDGVFGPHTKTVIIAFQKLKNLKPDGILGRFTRAALYPFGAGHLQIKVSKITGPATSPNSGQVAPAGHPLKTLTTGHFPGPLRPLPLPMPFLPPISLPPGSSQTSQTVQLKAGQQTSFPLRQFPSGKSSAATNTLALDFVGMIFTPRRIDLPLLGGSKGTLGIDLGLGLPITPGGKFTATATWAVTLAPELFKFGRFDLLSLSAKAGVGRTDPRRGRRNAAPIKAVREHVSGVILPQRERPITALFVTLARFGPGAMSHLSRSPFPSMNRAS